MTLNRSLKMVSVFCISLVFLISAAVHFDILINDSTDVPAAFLGRICFFMIDLAMAVWLLYNIKREFEPATFIGLMIVHSIASPAGINQLVTSHV